MKIVFKGWDDIDKIIQKGLTLFMRRRDGDIAPTHAYYLGGAIVGRRDFRLAPRGTRGDEARETKVGWAVFLRGQNNSDRMES